VRKFQPQGEQEETDADFSQQFDVMGLSDGQATGMGAKDNPGKDVAKDNGLVQPLHQQSAKKRSHYKKNDISGNAHGSFLCLW
jgi:hypothetical protein